MAGMSLPLLNPHEMRHTFGSILYERGVDIVTISKLMGHSSIEITVKLYVHDSLEKRWKLSKNCPSLYDIFTTLGPQIFTTFLRQFCANNTRF